MTILRTYAVVYMAGEYKYKDTWEAENLAEVRKVALDYYKNELDDFKMILSIEEI